MPYSITTKDGITINNIPDDVAPDSPDLKARVAAIRAGSPASQPSAQAASAQVTPTQQVDRDKDAIQILTQEFQKAQGRVQAGDTRAQGDLESIGRELARKGVNVSALPAPAASTPIAAPPPAPAPAPIAPAALPSPSTTATGLAGAATRGLALPAAGALAGAAMGAPFAGVGAIPGAIAGAGAATLAGMVGDPIVSGINSLFGTKYTLPTDAMEDLLTRVGVSQPRTAAERIVQTTAAGASGGAGGVAVGKTLEAAAAGPVARGVGQLMATTPGLQTLSSGTAGAAGGLAKESGAGPMGQIAATIGGAFVPSIPVATRAVTRQVARQFEPPAPAPARVEPTLETVIPTAGAPGESMGTAMAPGGAARGSVGAAAAPDAVRRVTTAESLRVPVTLTRGAATREAEQLAFENAQIKTNLGGPLRNRAEENNLQILQNFDATIDATGAKVAFAGPSATGGSVVNALSAGWEAAKNKTRVAYKKARTSPEAQAAVDTNSVVTIKAGVKGGEDITDSLIDYINKKITGLPSSEVPDTARKLLVKMDLASFDDAGNLISKPATVGKLEDFRKELSGTAKVGDEVGLRQETILKKLVDAQTDPVSGPLYKEARALRTKQANKFEDRAIVARLIKNRAGMKDPQVAVDQVFQRSILNGSPEEITFLKRVLLTSGKDGQQAFKELQAATAQHIRDQSTSGVGTDSAGRALVSPAKLNQVVSQLDKNGRLDVIFGKQEAARIRDLDEVVKYVTTVPPGTLINTSGTTGTLLAALAEAGTYGATAGIPVPVMTGINQIIKWRKAGQTKAKINDALNALPIVQP
jgi:hypothetical protein